MKIGVFTDSHYSSQVLTCRVRENRRSLEKMERAFFTFQEEKCDLVICLGDLIDREEDHKKEIENLSAVAKQMDRFSFPVICLMGNHDAFAFTVNEFYGVLGDNRRPKHLSLDGWDLIFLDTCYFSNGEHYAPGDDNWKDTFCPFPEELEEALSSAGENVVLWMHQNLDPNLPPHYCLSNAEKIREILEKSEKVRCVMQGHYHKGCRSVHNGISYTAFPAMCEREDAAFVLTEKDLKVSVKQ